MEFGAFFLAGSPEQLPGETVYSQLFEYIELAEQLGYDSVWFAEHHFSTYGYIPNPLMMAVKAAQITSRVRIGTAVLVLPFWHPLRVAEDIAMADHLTGGRMEIAVARGYQPYEFERFGLTMDDARERTDETLEILLQSLSHRDVSFSGRHYQIPSTTILPRPVQQPHPPIWLAAHTRESFEIAARLGLHAFTTNSGRPLSVLEQTWASFVAASQSHGDGRRRLFGVQSQLCVAPTDEEARAEMEHFLYASRQSTNLRLGRQQISGAYSQPIPYDGEPDLDTLFEQRTLSGSPATVREKLRAYTRVCDMSQLNCTFQLGAMPPGTIKRSMRLFAEEVMPAFRAVPAG